MLTKLQEINGQAALNSSRALSRLIDEPIDEIAKVELEAVETFKLTVGPEEIVAGIYMPVTGDITGASLLIIPKESAFILCDLLHKRKPGITRKLTALDKSALKEVGNIVSGNYFAVFSNRLEVKVIEQVPRFTFDMLGAITDEIATRFAEQAEKALIMQVRFRFKRADLDGYFLVMFQPEQMKMIQRLLD